MSSGQFFSYISWQEQVTFNDNDGVCYLTDQHVELDLYSACSLKQTVCRKTYRSTWTHYPALTPLKEFRGYRSWSFYTCCKQISRCLDLKTGFHPKIKFLFIVTIHNPVEYS